MKMAMMLSSVYDAWRFAQSLKDANDCAIPEWHLLSEIQQMAWMDVLTSGAKKIADSFGMEVLGADLGRHFYEAFQATNRRLNPNMPPFQQLPKREKLAWEAAARHLANIIDLDDDDISELGGTLEPHERRWQQWADARL